MFFLFENLLAVGGCAWHAERGGAEGVIARGPGDTEGPWVQNCQNRMQNYGLRTPLVYLGGAIVLCTPPLLTLLFSKKLQNQWCQVTEIRHTLLMVSVAYGQGRIKGVRMRGMHPPTSHFQTCF